MAAKGWRRPNGDWDISALHKKTGGSRRWLYRLIRGETNFGIDEYERILQKGFGLSFEVIMAGLNTSTIDRDTEDLYTHLKDAISNAEKTGTLEALRFAIYALADKAAADRALQEKVRAGPNSRSGEGEERTGGVAVGNRAKRKIKKSGT